MTQDEIDYWAQRPRWTLDEFSNICLNLDPRRGVVNEEIGATEKPPEIVKLLLDKKEAKRIIRDAVATDELKASNLKEIDKFLASDSGATESIKREIAALAFYGDTISFRPQDAIAWSISKRKLFPNLPANLEAPYDTTPTNDSIRKQLDESEVWKGFYNSLFKTIREYPAWAADKKKIQRSGNLKQWIKENLQEAERARETIKYIVADIYDIP